ncbi:MAG: tRNA glutamyl-Q(34) synthetase GluQRS [Cohaesibacter sp.]|jgi:glutamyl-Q tRNA(Asp) synthetase|nr:tRNA glutamyl-Q(34) synthetase GluQRS [Cohaesibacter sp.]
MKPVFRFAPSPNGALHLGHAFSALLNFELAKRLGGRFLLRMEDIDVIRCTPERRAQMLMDLEWLGLEWEEPVLYQSSRFEQYSGQLERLAQKDLIYSSSASRKDIKQAVLCAQESLEEAYPCDPDGAPLYPRDLLYDKESKEDGAPSALRLDMGRALCEIGADLPLFWREQGAGLEGAHVIGGKVMADPAAWGDVILARKDCLTSYHLSVVLDDAAQGITHCVRGLDLFWATSLHRLLQELLDLPQPTYYHHRLINNAWGEKLSKSRQDLSLAHLRESGTTLRDIKTMIEITDEDLAMGEGAVPK